ncbi:MAG: 1-acyl-sn-glycerol-3-phosphate acyltransferase [Candidatus Eremiobacteraeota bacterium]|nr:1-acyl-sn-glycerol-3-phosphate acyltransferase [Candidatus Eremiobacteraeota bacterium]
MTPFGLGVRAIAAYNLVRHMNLTVTGREHVPARGAALLAARHYHHLFDGAALVMGLPRQPHLFVALDWTSSRRQRRIMELACRLADWPVALRGENLAGEKSAFAPSDVRKYVRRSIAAGAKILARGDVLAIFPEGYPTIDPAGTRKTDPGAFLPFAPGLFAIAERAERVTGAPIPIVPVGFRYASANDGRVDVAMRIGAPLPQGGSRARDVRLRDLEARVRSLSE